MQQVVPVILEHQQVEQLMNAVHMKQVKLCVMAGRKFDG